MFLLCGAGLLLSNPVLGQLPGLDGVPPDGPPIGLGGALFPPVNIAPQRIVCSVTQQPLTVRAEGLAELLGDIVIKCTGNLRATPRNFVGVIPANYLTRPVPMPTINVGVTLSVPVTSRLVGDPYTEALLFVDEPDLPLRSFDDIRAQNPCFINALMDRCDIVQHEGLNFGGASDFSPVVAAGSPDDPLVGAATQNPTGRGIVASVFQSRRVNNQSISFQGVPLGFNDTRGNPRLLAAYNAIKAANGGVYAGQPVVATVTKTYRIKNLRGAIAGAASVNSQIFANLQIENPAGSLQLNSASVVVGQVLQGMNFRLRNLAGTDDPLAPLANLSACTSLNRALAVDATDATFWNNGNFSVQFTEGYGAAFRPRGYNPRQTVFVDQTRLDFNYNTESGYYNPFFPGQNGLRNAGIADHGTRLRAVFENVPANIRIYASAASTPGTSATAGAYAIVADANGASALSFLNVDSVVSVTAPSVPTALMAPIPAGHALLPFAGALPPALSFLTSPANQGLVNVPITNGRAVQIWEVYEARGDVTESINFIIGVAYRAPDNPGLGTATVRGTFAPIQTSATAGTTAVPVPRFVESGTPVNAFSIGPCVINLLFPFVTNQAGFNTGIAISNTSLTNPGTGELFPLDPLNAVGPNPMSCTINYFGTTGPDGASPPPASTGVIPAGRTFVMTLASGATGALGNVPAAPNFQGYLIAQCTSRYAHGYAFLSDLGATQLAQGYLALVMDGRFTSRTGNATESLSQ